MESSSSNALSKRRSSVGVPTAPPPKKQKPRSSLGADGSGGMGPPGVPLPPSQPSQHTAEVHPNMRAPPSTLAPRKLQQCENGTLLSILLRNFKSHANFEMEFGPRLNFIVGRNGTGKSSILAAIIAVMGGNPNKHSGTAGGARAAGGLIRDGFDSAYVELTIANGGPDPFVLDLCGAGSSGGAAPEKLVVALRLSRNGAQPHKTVSAYSINGRAVPLRTVRELADFYNYEVENPVVVNTQAVSASFLRDGRDEKKRYAFFLRASNLEALKLDYAQTESEMAKMESLVGSHAKGEAALRQRVAEAERRAEAAAERAELERAVLEADRRHCYAILAKSAAGVDVVREAAAGAAAALGDAEAAEAAAREALRVERNAAAVRQAQRNTELQRLSELNARVAELKREYKGASKAAQAAKASRAEGAAAEAQAAEAIEELEGRLAEQRAGLDAATRQADAALQRRVDGLSASAAAKRDELRAAGDAAARTEDRGSTRLNVITRAPVEHPIVVILVRECMSP